MTDGPEVPDVPDAPSAADSPVDRRQRLLKALPWVVVGVVMVALAGVAVVRLFIAEPERPGEAGSVRDVADMAQAISEELDVDSGLDLLCEEPIQLYRMAVEATIIRWQTLSGSPAPEITARVSEVDDGPTGSFLLRLSSDEDGIQDEARRTFRVFVESRDGRSCVVGIGGRKADRASVRFAGDGYSDVTSPTPTPRP